MNRLLSVLALAAAASLFLAAAPDTPPVPVAPIDLRIDISPTPLVNGPYELLIPERRPDTYTCSAMLIDEPHRLIYSGVKVVVHPGEELTKTTTSPGLTMTLKGKVDAARKGAVADVSVFRDGKLVAHQHSRVFLSGGGHSPIY